ncbi:hypothetical protein J2S57_005889 [Kineosporia succinea]|uniref:Uncharacterized protein n=1 Tax=Kineosporia succinea TaxID=84632 RepID=A0ABT9PBR7_9ACTN|nr:hypothetical protein [Kineosporia succinea]
MPQARIGASGPGPPRFRLIVGIGDLPELAAGADLTR